MRSQDNTLTPGRRVLLEDGLRGNPYSAAYYTEITDGDGASPLFTTTNSREAKKLLNVPVTPGHFLVLEAHCLPSGPTRDVINDISGNPETEVSGDTGAIKLTATWDDGSTTVTVTRTLTFNAAPTDYGHGLDSPGAGFGQLQSQAIHLAPPGMLSDHTEQVEWTQSGITVDLTLEYLGSVRPVDVCVSEAPLVYARADGIPAGPGHIYSFGGVPLTDYPLQYPAEGASSGDRRFGSAHALDVAEAAQYQTGPMLLNLGAYSGARRQSGGEPIPFTVSGTSYRYLGYSGAAVGAAPSYDFSAATFGRTFRDSSDITDAGVCQVKISIYWKTEAGTSTARFRTAPYSYVDLQTSSTSYEWTHAVGFLDCSQTVLDDFQLDLQVANDDGGSPRTTSVLYVQVAYMPE
jgi:hypothetical protein